MLFALFAAMPNVAAGDTPQVSAISAASLRAGTCGPSSVLLAAQVRVSWDLGSMDTDAYDTKLYENNVLVATPTGESQWDKTITGSVEYGNRSPWFASWTYRLDVVRKSDGQVVASLESAPFEMEYGSCGTGGIQLQ